MKRLVKKSSNNISFEVGNGNINAYINGVYCGFLTFIIHEDREIIEIDELEVDDEYQNQGIGQEIYKKLSEIYHQQYEGWGIERHFLNPIAEYSFRKVVSEGYFPESILNEDNITREYQYANPEDIVDLRQKLPENVRGPETWAKRR